MRSIIVPLELTVRLVPDALGIWVFVLAFLKIFTKFEQSLVNFCFLLHSAQLDIARGPSRHLGI
jgi:hypothetical protein